MRRGLGFLGLLVTIVIIAVVGVIAYQAGWSDGFAQHLPQAGTTAAPAAGYYPYYYGGPHFFGFGWIFGLLFFFFIFWLFARLAFGFGRWGRRGWGPGGGTDGRCSAVFCRLLGRGRSVGAAPARQCAEST